MLALRFEGKLEWDSETGLFTNNKEANKYLQPPRLQGLGLVGWAGDETKGRNGLGLKLPPVALGGARTPRACGLFSGTCNDFVVG